MSNQDVPYTNREIREKWHENSNALQEIKTEIQETKREAKATNGSVAEINRWRERVTGGFWVAGVFMTFLVVPILSWAIYVLVNIDSTIDNSVHNALQAYDLTIK